MLKSLTLKRLWGVSLEMTLYQFTITVEGQMKLLKSYEDQAKRKKL